MTMRPICSDDPSGSIAQAVIDTVFRAAPEGLNLHLTLDSSLEEAGLDSLTRMQVVNCLEEAFHIRFTEDSLYDIETCRDLVGYIAAKTAPPTKCRVPFAAETPPRKAEVVAGRNIEPECYEVERVPECVALAQRVAGTVAAGLENPFFRV